MILNDAESFARLQNIFNPENFDRKLREAAEFVQEYTAEYKSLPSVDQINSVLDLNLKRVPVGDDHSEWLLDEFEKFTKRKELERAILKSYDLLEKGEFNPVEKLIKNAVQIGLTRDLGTDYFADPKGRILKLKEKNGQISSGWMDLDKKLFGGFNRGELNIFAGGSGSGKSLFLQNLAVNWITQKYNGVYITLELSEGLSALRIDAMIANMSTNEVKFEVDMAEMKIKMVGKKCGNLQIKYMPAQSNINDIRTYIKELELHWGVKLDFIMVDYLDLLTPVTAKVSPNDLFVKDKYVSEELRNLATELDCVFVTASQLNRQAVEEIEFDHSHIAGGLSKINTADNVFGIFTSRAMRERGRYQLQLMKTRSSSGVGQKIDLAFDARTLRITDLPEDAETNSPLTSEVVYGKIKEGSSSDAAKITASVQASQVKNMLSELRNEKN